MYKLDTRKDIISVDRAIELFQDGGVIVIDYDMIYKLNFTGIDKETSKKRYGFISVDGHIGLTGKGTDIKELMRSFHNEVLVFGNKKDYVDWLSKRIKEKQNE